jgi:hypothetical protein
MRKGAIMERKELEPVSQDHKGFYGKAWVVKIDPGIEVLESFGRPTALWLDSTRQVYLLRGWNVTLTSTAHVRHFASRKTGMSISTNKQLHQALRHSTDLVDCAVLGALPHEALDVLAALLDLYVSDEHRPYQMTARNAPAAPSKGSRPLRSYEPISILLHEWLEETGGITIGRAANLRPTNVQVNQLLVDAGYLNQDKSPTTKGENIGMVLERGNAGHEDEFVYTLYPRNRFPEYRKLITGLYADYLKNSLVASSD